MTPRLPRGRRAFTLLEMLIVIGIIVVLLGLLLPAVNRAREQGRRAVCAANLRNLGGAMLKYATENNSKLPQHAGNSYWLFDIPLGSRDAMVVSGAVRESFYCPSNAAMQNDDKLWNFPSGDPRTAEHSATGYQWLFFRPAAPGRATPPQMLFGRKYLKSIQDSITLILPPAEGGTKTITSSAAIELATDMVNSRGTVGSDTENFTGARGGHPLGHHTSHMRGKKPAGGNILFLDGHVEWRDFKSMRLQHDPPDGNHYYF